MSASMTRCSTWRLGLRKYLWLLQGRASCWLFTCGVPKIFFGRLCRRRLCRRRADYPHFTTRMHYFDVVLKAALAAGGNAEYFSQRCYGQWAADPATCLFCSFATWQLDVLRCLMCRVQSQRTFGYLWFQAYVLVHASVSSQSSE